jgi:hypothetical protein
MGTIIEKSTPLSEQLSDMADKYPMSAVIGTDISPIHCAA